MRKLPLGRSGIRVSEFCLGTDFFGTKRSRELSFELLDAFREQGGNFLDTANFYASWMPGFVGGESETTIGVWMKERGSRDEVVVASKLAFDYPGSGGGLNAAEIERECDKSLRRLGTDRIDLYYAHRDDRAAPLAETMEAFDRLIRAGKVCAIGASNLTVWRIAEANLLSELRSWASYCAIEQRYTYLRPRFGATFGPQIFMNDDLREFARAHSLALVGYSTLLAGGYTNPAKLPAQFVGPETEPRLAALAQVARETGATVNQVILAWMRQSDPPVLPIIAASGVEQLVQNISSTAVPLSEDQMKRLDTAGCSPEASGWIQGT